MLYMKILQEMKINYEKTLINLKSFWYWNIISYNLLQTGIFFG